MDESPSDYTVPPVEKPSESLHDFSAQLRELIAYGSMYVSAKIDSLRLSVRNIILLAVAGVVVVVGGLSAVAVAVVLVFVGLSQLIAALLGGRAWAGNLIVGSVMLVVTALAFWILLNRVLGSSRKRTRKRYDRRLRQQQEDLRGHDAKQRAAEYRAARAAGFAQ